MGSVKEGITGALAAYFDGGGYPLNRRVPNGMHGGVGGGEGYPRPLPDWSLNLISTVIARSISSWRNFRPNSYIIKLIKWCIIRDVRRNFN